MKTVIVSVVSDVMGPYFEKVTPVQLEQLQTSWAKFFAALGKEAGHPDVSRDADMLGRIIFHSIANEEPSVEILQDFNRLTEAMMSSNTNDDDRFVRNFCASDFGVKVMARIKDRIKQTEDISKGNANVDLAIAEWAALTENQKAGCKHLLLFSTIRKTWRGRLLKFCQPWPAWRSCPTCCTAPQMPARQRLSNSAAEFRLTWSCFGTRASARISPMPWFHSCRTRMS